MGSVRKRSIMPSCRSVLRPDRRPHGRGRQVQGQDAGQQEVDVAAAAGDRDGAAEDVDEQHREQQRLDRHVRELHGLPGDVHDVAPGHGPDVGQRAEQVPARVRAGRTRSPTASMWSVVMRVLLPVRDGLRRTRRGRPDRRPRRPIHCARRLRRHRPSAPAPSSSMWPPVSEKNTSSSDGWRTSMLSTSTPASSSARTTTVARPGRRVHAGTQVPPVVADLDRRPPPAAPWRRRRPRAARPASPPGGRPGSPPSAPAASPGRSPGRGRRPRCRGPARRPPPGTASSAAR